MIQLIKTQNLFFMSSIVLTALCTVATILFVIIVKTEFPSIIVRSFPFRKK